MNIIEFETKLNHIYGGTLRPLTSYYNQYAFMVFKCETCDITFFGRPKLIVGKEHQIHVCHYPYGNNYGERMTTVNNRNSKRNKKDKVTAGIIEKMIADGYTYNEIAKKIEVNPKIIKDHFIQEGLI